MHFVDVVVITSIDFSVTKTKLKCLLVKFCKDIDIGIAFTSCKIQDYFWLKIVFPTTLSLELYINLFVQAVMLAMWVKPQDTFLAE